jgi:hypothetical protein
MHAISLEKIVAVLKGRYEITITLLTTSLRPLRLVAARQWSGYFAQRLFRYDWRDLQSNQESTIDDVATHLAQAQEQRIFINTSPCRKSISPLPGGKIAGKAGTALTGEPPVAAFNAATPSVSTAMVIS